jgi:shikimate kinase
VGGKARGFFFWGGGMNLVLTGYRCSGKSSVGRILASKLGMEFSDTDAFIEERTGTDIETLVAEYGWDHFREEEQKAVGLLARLDSRVIATGGGVVLTEKNIRNLKAKGWVVWLKAEPRVLEKRMREEQERGVVRPPLTGEDPLEEIERVLEERTPYYEESADFVIDTGRLSLHAAAEEIIRTFETARGA